MDQAISDLLHYAQTNHLLDARDEVYAANRILAMLGLSSYEKKIPRRRALEDILKDLLDDAVQRGVCEDSVVARDLLDTAVMGCVTPPPSKVIGDFEERYAVSPKAATDQFYAFSQNTDYIRRYRIAKDLRWKVETPYGEMDITVNLSKPEKDPKSIAAAKNAPQSGYPACMLCRETEGYAGRGNFPARQNHRIIPITLGGKAWGLQYSPYVYYNEHCIALNFRHVPMKIDREAFEKLFDFVTLFPHYFIGSNADLPIVGGSILSHEHFQGGLYTFAMAKAPVVREVTVKDYEEISVGRVHWPLSVVRLRSRDRRKLVDLADRIFTLWRMWQDEEAGILPFTGTEPHNTVTPIARRRDEEYELDLVLRNNRTTPEHPLGLFHPHAQWHHIKKENIGLIEVMGLAVLPARLKEEMAILKEILVDGGDPAEDSRVALHADWAKELQQNYTVTEQNADAILQQEIGKVFCHVLEDAGVFKQTEEGLKHFDRFLDAL